MSVVSWTPEENETIRQFAGLLTATEIAKRLRRRTCNAVNQQATKLRISLRTPETTVALPCHPKPTTMSKEQAAIIIKEAIREVAFTSRRKPSEIHLPRQNDTDAIAARNRAIRLAHRQGVDKATLGSAFQRTPQCINSIIAPPKQPCNR